MKVAIHTKGVQRNKAWCPGGVVHAEKHCGHVRALGIRQVVTNLWTSHWTRVVNNLLRYLLFAVFFALAALPSLGRAASGGYVSLHVPDLPQAIGFFHDVMNCDVIAQNSATDAASAMLDCGDGSTVELVRRKGALAIDPTVILSTNNAAAASAWLRAHHVTIVGLPVRITDGVESERVVVDFVTPWGQPMQLVSHGHADDGSAATRLAAQ
jgi:catechol 2,3-dioxygenase-like lactoylglutathione lyase family enzyme